MKSSIQTKLFLILSVLMISCQTTGRQISQGGVGLLTSRQLEARFEFYAEESYRRGRYLDAIRYATAIAEINQGKSGRELSESLPFLKARNWLQSIRFELSTSLPEGWVQKEYDKLLIVRSFLGDKLLPGLATEVTEYFSTSQGSSSGKTVEYVSDAAGILSIALSTPVSTGSHEIQVAVSADKVLGDAVAGVRFSDEARQSVADILPSLTLNLSVPVRSAKADFPIIVYVADTDATGNHIIPRTTQKEIQNILEEGGLVVQGVEDSSILTREEVLQRASESGVPRVAFGLTEIRQFEESDAGISIEVFGRVEAVDVRTNRVLVRAEETQRTSGTGSSTVLRVAFQTLGKKIGNRIFSRLP